MTPTLEQHLNSARDEWEARQRFLKSGETIHQTGMKFGKTLCGLSDYQWEEYAWEEMPLADDPSEVTCKNCLAAMKKA
jgi:hypothetical protein